MTIIIVKLKENSKKRQLGKKECHGRKRKKFVHAPANVEKGDTSMLRHEQENKRQHRQAGRQAGFKRLL